jgi:hypothetical protein
MATVCSLLAETPWFHNPEIMLALGSLAVAFAVGAGLLYWADRWRKRQLAVSADDPSAELTSYRALYDAGELSKEEYERIRAKLADKLKAKFAVPAIPPAPPNEPPGA